MRSRSSVRFCRTLPLALLLLAIGSCYNPELEDCTVRCGSGNSCPAGQHCDQGFCAASGRSCDPSASSGASGSIPVSTDQVFWFDATRGLGPGPGIGTWEDSSDKANHATQEESALQPQLTSFADLPAVSFDGVDYLSLRPEFPDFSRGLAFLVVLRLDPLRPLQSQLFQISSQIGTGGITTDFYEDGEVHYQAFAGALEWQGPIPTEQVAILGVNVSPASGGNLYFNGLSVSENPTLSVPILEEPGPTLDNQLGLGRDFEYTAFKGLLFEFVFYNRVLDADELPAMVTYLREKWRCCE